MVDLNLAADICHSPFLHDRRTADILRDYRPGLAKALALGFDADRNRIDALSMDANAFLIGMVSPEGLIAAIDDGRLALERMRVAVSEAQKLWPAER